MKRIAAMAVAFLCVAGAALAETYTYNEMTSTTTQWSAGTSWMLPDTTPTVPVSAADTILTFTYATGNWVPNPDPTKPDVWVPDPLPAGTNVVSNNDIAGNFLLNRLNFTYAGPASGTAPTVTISGNPLEFTGTSAQIFYNPSGTSASRPKLIINSNIVLSSNLTVHGNTSGTTPSTILAGAVSGDYRVQFQGLSGQATSYMLSNPSNSYTGNTQIYYSSSSGRGTTLRLGASDVIPNGVGKGNLYLSAPGEAGGVTVQLYGNNETVNGLESTIPRGANGSVAVHNVQNSAATASTLTVGDNDTTASYYGRLLNGSTGVLNVTKIGAGTQTLAGTNTYTGTTTISGGTLKSDYTQIGTSRTATPSNYFSPNTGLILDDSATFAIEGRGDGGAYYREGYASPAYNRVLNIPNAEAATLVVGQPVNLTKTGGTGNLGAAGDSYCIQAFGTVGATTTQLIMNSRIVSASGVTVTVDIPATVAETNQTLASLTLSGDATSNATLDFGSSANVTLTINSAPVQLTDGSTLTIANWSGIPGTGGGAEKLLFTGAPSEFSSVFGQSEVIFVGYNSDNPGYALIDNGGSYEVTAIPEPSLIGLLVVGGLLLRLRRRPA